MDVTAVHEPVLLKEVLASFSFSAGAAIVDATLGQAGHSIALAQRLGTSGRLIGLDVDEGALAIASQKLASTPCRVDLVRENFGSLDAVLDDLQITAVDAILADLGISSGQLGQADFGLSFQLDGPLDMRLDKRLETTAADLVNTLRPDDLANIIYRYGEERRSRAIARAIERRRHKKKIERTGELADIVISALGMRSSRGKSKIHPATRTFQALRIAVNDELGQLERLLDVSRQRLKPGGELAIISFHSLEDRIVKHTFRDWKQQGQAQILTKKPIIAEDDERQRNPRSRSAKMRVARMMTPPVLA